jgi:hypothetical protein
MLGLTVMMCPDGVSTEGGSAVFAFDCKCCAYSETRHTCLNSSGDADCKSLQHGWIGRNPIKMSRGVIISSIFHYQLLLGLQYLVF